MSSRAGLWAGIELHDWAGKAKGFCMKLLDMGLLCKDTHEQAIRLAPDWPKAYLRTARALMSLERGAEAGGANARGGPHLQAL